MLNDERNRLRLFPRGFLGGAIEPQVERTKKPFDDRKTELHYAVNQHNTSDSSIIANPDVESLYATLIKNDIKITSPAFRTNALEVALNSFGSISFLIWFASQYHSPAAGNLHGKFLIDTLKFISTGVRNMSMETWNSLIMITDEGDKIGVMPDAAKEFFGLSDVSDLRGARQNTMLTDIIQQWCSKPGGLEDMIGSMHIFFGNV